jgi:hypothetical protein
VARPSVYTPEIAEEICRRIAEGESLVRICEDDHMPGRTAVTMWIIDDREGFANNYARARMAQAVHYAEEIVQIADQKDPEDVARDRLRVDTRKWYLSKVLPKIFGDKLDLDHSGAVTIRVVYDGDE